MIIDITGQSPLVETRVMCVKYNKTDASLFSNPRVYRLFCGSVEIKNFII